MSENQFSSQFCHQSANLPTKKHKCVSQMWQEYNNNIENVCKYRAYESLKLVILKNESRKLGHKRTSTLVGWFKTFDSAFMPSTLLFFCMLEFPSTCVVRTRARKCWDLLTTLNFSHFLSSVSVTFFVHNFDDFFRIFHHQRNSNWNWDSRLLPRISEESQTHERIVKTIREWISSCLKKIKFLLKSLASMRDERRGELIN